MKASVTTVAVEDLVGVIVEAAEAYFAVGLKKFVIGVAFAFGRFHQFLIVYQLLQLLVSLITKTMLEIFEDSTPHKFIPDILYLLFVI